MNNNPTPTSRQQEILDRILRNVDERRDKKVNEWKARYTLADGVKIFKHDWASLMKAHFGHIPAAPISNARDVPRIKRNVVTPLRDADLTVSALLRFVFDNWALIRSSSQFRNFKTYPTAPALAWFLKFADLYISAFVEYQTMNTTIFEEPEKQRRQESSEKKKELTSKIVRVARDELRKKEAEIARLKAENKSLRLRKPSGKTRKAAKPNNLPDWN
jgi:hypothetical protein